MEDHIRGEVLEDQLLDGKRQEANDILDIIEDNVDDLDKCSVRNDDFLSSEVYEIRELVKRARRQLK